MIFYVSCIVLLILCTYSIFPSFLRIGIDTDAQESPILSCSDGSVPDAITGLCADGFAPQSNLSELPSTVPDSALLAGDNVTAISNITASQLLNENELVSGEINASAPASEEIQMDTNGDGVVDEAESQNQPAVTGNALHSEEIQMDTNGDGVVDEAESQNQPAVTGNALHSEEIQMDTNGDGVVDEAESQNQPAVTGNALHSEEIQMDTNGDGVVDEAESQNQPAVTGNALHSEEIQMDTNGDGVVDETESQNQPAVRGNALPSEEIQMDTNGDGIVDEAESQNTAGSNAVQGSGGPGSQTQCEGDLADDCPLARKTLDVADQDAKDFVRLLQAGGGIKQFPSTNLYWFAKLYSSTTYLELRDLKNVEHPAMVAHFIPIFFGLYKDAMDNYQNRAASKVPAHWMAHFKASQDSKVSMTGAQISIET